MTIVSFFIIGILVAVLYFLLPILLNLYMKLVLLLVKKILSYQMFHKKIFLYFTYILYFIFTSVFIYYIFNFYFSSLRSYKFLWIMIIYSMAIIFLGILLSRLELLVGKVKIFKKCKLVKYIKINIISYIKRFKIDNTLFYLGVYLTIFYLLITISTVINLRDISYLVLFIYVVIIPIILVIFVHLGNKTKAEGNFRRILIYLLLLLAVLPQTYSVFLEIFDEKGINPFLGFLIYITLTIFTALDNLVLAILKDHKEYKEKDMSKFEVIYQINKSQYNKSTTKNRDKT